MSVSKFTINIVSPFVDAVSISPSGCNNHTVLPIPRSSWYSAEYNIPSLVFSIATFVLPFWEEMGVWAACRNSARAVVPAVFLRAMWNEQAPEPPFLLQRQDPAQQLPPRAWMHPSIPPTSSTPAANARWIQRCSFRFSPVSFSTLVFNSVSTDRCRQM